MERETITLLAGTRIVLGVTGSIAVYKAVDLASKLTQAGVRVEVIMTRAAQEFVTPLTFQAVTGQPVYTDLWQTDRSGGLPTHIAHVGLAEQASLLAIIPATADVIARLANGRADDLLAVTALAARCPLLVAPAMDGNMYQHPAVQANLLTLRERGAFIVEPEQGRFASGLIGQGRLPETPTLIGAIRRALGHGGLLKDRKVVVTAGGTREPLDPVRYLTNRSSGKQGYALAQAALDQGADVTLVTTARHLPPPYGARIIAVDTAEQMQTAVVNNVTSADALIMAAAVADFRPHTTADHKIKKTDDSSTLLLTLEKTTDILGVVKELRRNSRWPRVVVGFAAETDHLIEYARDKINRKGVDLIVANDISATDAGFDTDTNRVIILDGNGQQEQLELASKTKISEHIIRRVAQMLQQQRR